jgi:hypothetical protein
MTRVVPFVVPLVYLGAILWLQPADRLGDPESAPWLGRALYDDYDATAFALRGLNASLGRSAGRLDEPARKGPEAFAEALQEKSPPGAGDTPYYLEYPHAALLLFRLPYWFPPSVRDLDTLPGILDALHLDLVEHVPQTASEQALWRKLRQAIRFYNVAGIGCLAALLLVLRWGYEPGSGRSEPLVLLLLPASLYFAANRFDIVPAMLMALGLAFLGRKYVAASGVLFGLATLVKLYPVLVAPLVVRYLVGNRREAAVWSLAFALTLGVVLAGTVWLTGWEATLAPYRFQLSRALGALTFFGPVWPESWAENTLVGRAVRLGSVVAVVLLLAWTKPANLDGLLRRSAVVLVVFVSFQVFYSPQWILWLMPLLVPLAGRQRDLISLVIGLDLVTYLTFPLVYDSGDSPYQAELLTVLVYGRAFFLAVLAGVLLRAEFRIPWRRPWFALSEGTPTSPRPTASRPRP